MVVAGDGGNVQAPVRVVGDGRQLVGVERVGHGGLLLDRNTEKLKKQLSAAEMAVVVACSRRSRGYFGTLTATGLPRCTW